MKDLLNNLTKSLGSGNITDNIQSTLGSLQAKVGENVKSGSLPNLGSLNIGSMLGSAAVGGVLGALFSGKSAKKIAKGALVAGGTAAAGALAWKFYQKWSKTDNTAQTVATAADTTTIQPAGSVAIPAGVNQTALLLVEAMVYAARADGNIDESERDNIYKAVNAFFPQQNMEPWLESLMNKPVDPHTLATKVQNMEEAHDLYRLSCAVVVVDSFMERSYLDGLANALQITEADKTRLEQEATEAMQSA